MDVNRNYLEYYPLPEAPRCLNSEYVTQARKTLLELFRNNPSEFKRIFQSSWPPEPLMKASFKYLLYPNPIEILEQAGIVFLYRSTVEPTCRINIVDDEYPLLICTDPPQCGKKRVFPYTDDAENMFRVLSDDIIHEPRIIVDLCSGNGIVGIKLAKLYSGSVDKVYCLDNDQRALEYAEFNASLNDVKGFRVFEWDALRKENPEDIVMDMNLHHKVDFLCAVPPFTLHPPWFDGYSHSDAGEYGHRITHAILDFIPYFLRSGGIFVMTAYSLGTAEDIKTTKIFNEIKSKLHEDEYDIESFKTIPDVKLWRLWGRKRFPYNPMSIEYISSRFFDPAYNVEFEQRGKTYEDYVEWIEKLKKQNLTHLYYLYLKIRRRKK